MNDTELAEVLTATAPSPSTPFSGAEVRRVAQRRRARRQGAVGAALLVFAVSGFAAFQASQSDRGLVVEAHDNQPADQQVAGSEDRDEPSSLYGNWRLVTGRGPRGDIPSPDGAAPITLDIGPRRLDVVGDVPEDLSTVNTTFVGTDVCGRYELWASTQPTGRVAFSEGWRSFSLNLCRPVARDVRIAYAAAMEEVDRWAVEDGGDRLELTGEGVVLVYERRSSAG